MRPGSAQALRDHRLIGRTSERWLAGQHLIENSRQGILVGSGIDGLVGGCLLRAHVQRGSHGEPGPGQPACFSSGTGCPSAALDRPGNTKIRDHRVAATQEDVLRLDVPMHHAVLVRVSQRIRHFGGHRGGRTNRQPALALEPLPERLAFDIGHDEVRQWGTSAIVDHPGVEDRKDVRVLQPSHELDLAEKPLATLPAAQFGTDYLQGHRALMAKVSGEIHRGHPAGPDLPLEQVPLAERRGQTLRYGTHGTKNLRRMGILRRRLSPLDC
jgi:hypothetical protein